MIEIKVEGSIVSVQERVPLYTGTTDAIECHFNFDKRWDRFQKTAIFRAGEKCCTVLIGENSSCALPWEILTRENIGQQPEIGVYGVNAQTEIITSVWDTLGTIREGSEPGEDARDPSAGIYEQIMALVQSIGKRVTDYSGDMQTLIRQAETAVHLATDSAQAATGDLERVRNLVEEYGCVQGEKGNGIEKILRTGGNGSPGTDDIYTIFLTDGGTATFTIHNAADSTGFFTLSVDEDGNLWAHSAGGGGAPDFEYETDSGALYIVQEV